MSFRPPGTLSLIPLALASAVASAQAPARADVATTPDFACVFATSPNVLTETQPDGRQVELTFHGGAEQQWYQDLAGYSVLHDRGWYVYAFQDQSGALVPTRLRVGRVDPATVGGLLPNARPVAPDAAGPRVKRRPAADGAGSGVFAGGSGSVRNLVLLLRFSNHGPGGQNRTLPSVSDVTRIMNAVGGDPTLAPTGSVRDHYLETSYGQFTIDSTVAGWFDMPNTESYYADGSSGLTSLTWDLIIAGLNAADPSIDFSQYDQDADGRIDAITFLHSGYGAEWGGTDQYGTPSSNRMWSHKWEIPTWTSAEGVTVSEYNISPGLWGTSGSGPGRIGVVVHELGHFFGLPDLYDTNGNGQGLGNWGIMGGGSWGFDGSQQHSAHPSAWSKIKMGWVAAERLFPGTHSALQVETNQSIFLLDSGYPHGEYLLLENRQPAGFETVIPQGGLAIWHIDEGKGSMGFNDPNTDEGYPGQSGWPGNGRHYRNALLQADNGYDMEKNFDRGDSTDMYRGGGGVSSITNSTSPNTRAYQGGNIVSNDNRVTSIGSSSATMSFTYSNPSKPSITTSSLLTAPVGISTAISLTASGGAGAYEWSEYRSAASVSGRELGASGFANVGVARGWQADEGLWAYDLPFPFPFYEEDFDRVWVSSNGFLDFHPIQDAEPFNQKTHFKFSTRIAPLWDDLDTSGFGEDIFVDASVTDQVTIRWKGHEFNSGDPCNVSVTLHRNGSIVFHYGSGNTSLTPTVGVSRGRGADLELATGRDGATSLGNARSFQFDLAGTQLPPGMRIESGQLRGTVNAPGSWSPTLRVTDGNHVYDERSVTIEAFFDCNLNGVDDALETDCNGNGTPDDCDISAGTSQDIDANGVPDDCQILSKPARRA